MQPDATHAFVHFTYRLISLLYCFVQQIHPIMQTSQTQELTADKINMADSDMDSCHKSLISPAHIFLQFYVEDRDSGSCILPEYILHQPHTGWDSHKDLTSVDMILPQSSPDTDNSSPPKTWEN